MAVTRTRTRTQSALTKIAELIAEAHGELRVLAELEEQVRQEMAGGGNGAGRRRKKAMPAPDALLAGIAARRVEIARTRDALYMTLRQFDPSLDPRQVGESFEWAKVYGRGTSGRNRYAVALTKEA